MCLFPYCCLCIPDIDRLLSVQTEPNEESTSTIGEQRTQRINTEQMGQRVETKMGSKGDGVSAMSERMDCMSGME